MSRLVVHEGDGWRLPERVQLDDRISSTAKWVLGYLASRPPGWQVRRKDLHNKCSEGKRALSTAISQLQKFGYLEIERVRGSRGRFEKVTWTVWPRGREHTATTSPRSDKWERGAEPVTTRAEPRSRNQETGPDSSSSNELLFSRSRASLDAQARASGFNNDMDTIGSREVSSGHTTDEELGFSEGEAADPGLGFDQFQPRPAFGSYENGSHVYRGPRSISETLQELEGAEPRERSPTTRACPGCGINSIPVHWTPRAVCGRCMASETPVR